MFPYIFLSCCTYLFVRALRPPSVILTVCSYRLLPISGGRASGNKNPERDEAKQERRECVVSYCVVALGTAFDSEDGVEQRTGLEAQGNSAFVDQAKLADGKSGGDERDGGLATEGCNQGNPVILQRERLLDVVVESDRGDLLSLLLDVISSRFRAWLVERR